MSHDAIENKFPEFIRQVEDRLRKGAAQYGDASFSRTPSELLCELRQECLDLAGWGFILHCRIEQILRELHAGCTNGEAFHKF